MKWPRFWVALGTVGEAGAPRCEWQRLLDDSFGAFAAFLQAGKNLALTVRDPDTPTRVLDLHERPDGNFEAHSQQIPAHRPPLVLSRTEIVILAPKLAALAGHLAGQIGFVSGNYGPTRIGNFHELGLLTPPPASAPPCFLLRSDRQTAWPRPQGGLLCDQLRRRPLANGHEVQCRNP
jgi:hypothetical protein